MTYIVARASPDIAFMISDTLLTPLFPIKGQEGPVNGQYHALKVQIVNENVAIGFSTSDNVDVCIEIINSVREALLQNGELNVPNAILETYRKLRGQRHPYPDCEFLVIELAATKKLSHVTSDTVRICERAYIGDPKAHQRASRLRKTFYPPKTQFVQQPDGSLREVAVTMSDAEIDYRETSDAVDALVSERRVAGVGAIGGYTLVVVNARISGKFEYMQSVERGRTPEEGVVGYALLAANEGPRGVAIYYDGGRFGYVLPVGDASLCYKERANSVQ